MQVLQVFEGGYTDIQAGMGKSQNNVLHSSQGCGGGSGGAGVSVSGLVSPNVEHHKVIQSWPRQKRQTNIDHS